MKSRIIDDLVAKFSDPRSIELFLDFERHPENYLMDFKYILYVELKHQLIKKLHSPNVAMENLDDYEKNILQVLLAG